MQSGRARFQGFYVRPQVSTFKSLIKTSYRKLMAKFAQCTLCQQDCQQASLVCQQCLEDVWCWPLTEDSLPLNLLRQPVVAPLFYKQVHSQDHRQAIDALYCLSLYHRPVSDWLVALKFDQGLTQLSSLHALFFSRMAKALKARLNGEDFTLVPVPSADKTFRRRGYNQAQLLGEPIAHKLELEFEPRLLKRHRFSPSQVGQSGARRRANLKGAFSIELERSSKMAPPKRVILFDDVVTTGATVNEIARVLKQAGVKEVIVVAIAIALDEKTVAKLPY